jgi:hypothetical protein
MKILITGALVAFVVACTASSETTSRKAAGWACAQDSDCEPGLFCDSEEVRSSRYFCKKPCTGNAECGDDTCGLTGSGQRACGPRCDPSSSTESIYDGKPRDLLCVDGARVPCLFAPVDTCRCECPEGEHCRIKDARPVCAPARPLGEPCDAHLQCASGHCGGDIQARVCQVAVGQKCTADNCERCQNGYCQANCDGIRECPDETVCIHESFSNTSGCRLKCSDTKPCPAPLKCLSAKGVDSRFCEAQ